MEVQAKVEGQWGNHHNDPYDNYLMFGKDRSSHLKDAPARFWVQGVGRRVKGEE